MNKLRNSTNEAFEEMKLAFFKNAYRYVRKAYFDRRTILKWILRWNQYSL